MTIAAGPLPANYRFALDEDLSPRISEIARGLGLDVVSVHEIGRRGMPDDDQLRWAAREGRILITRNRDDFIEWTVAFFQRGEPHAGVLLITTLLSIQSPARVVHAIGHWVDDAKARFGGDSPTPYFIDFLTDADPTTGAA
jgi:predicted nuclease of predicted toxin-antitoxin system